MTRLNPSSLLFAALAFSQACIALVSAAELKVGDWGMIEQDPFSFGVGLVDEGKAFGVTAVQKKNGAVWRLQRGSSEGSFALLGLFSGRYLTVLGEVAEQNSQIGMAIKKFDWRLENAEDGTDKYRISPFSATSLTIQKSADSDKLVLQPKSDQQPGADAWVFKFKKAPI